MRYLRTVCADCRCVSVIPEDRCAAVQQLVRPRELARLVARQPRFRLAPGGPPAERAARWLQTRLAVGDLCYITDPRACDRWCAPAETLRRGGGDCDDFAILGVSLLRALGVPAFVIVGRTCDGSGCAWHAWVEGRDRRGRFHLEATSGALVRGPWRPAGYHADLVLGPGVCVRAA